MTREGYRTSAWALPARPEAAKVRGMARARALLTFVVFAAGLACGGAGQSDATKNRTFYDWSLGDGSQAFEKPYPRLDWPEKSESPRFIGVSILKDQVYFSRPRNWRVRNASNRPDEPYIQYVSPNAYS